LKSGDVVLGVNGRDIDQLSELTSTIAGIQAGTNARLQVWRNGSRQDINVTVGELSEQKVAALGAGEPGGADTSG